MPTQERLKELFHYDPDTGIFTRACNRKRWKAGEVAGTLSCGYISINIDRTVYRAHRLAWVYMTGEAPEAGIDHINGNPLDNRFFNLRPAAQAENCLNKRITSKSKIGVKGVQAHREKYCARIQRDGKSYYLGSFNTIDEAKAAYDAAGRVLHGEFFRS